MMTANSLEDLAEFLRSQSLKVIKTTSGYQAQCPAHEDRKPSLSLSRGNSQEVVWKCQAGCSQEAVLEALRGLGWGVRASGGSFPTNTHPRPISPDMRGKEITYSYETAEGEAKWQVRRHEPKDFRTWHKEGEEWKPGGTPKAPYRLPQAISTLRNGETLYIVEGEKDADNLIKYATDYGLNISATCNALGAGKWRNQHTLPLPSGQVVIVADKDEAGRNHALAVAGTFRNLQREVPRILEAKTGKDITDHLEAGHTLEELIPLTSLPEAPEAPAEPSRGSTWAPVNLLELMAGEYEPPAPSFLTRTDGLSLLYPGKVHTIYGEPSSGKSTLVYSEAVEVLKSGKRVLIIDTENAPGDLLYKFRKLGATPEALNITPEAFADLLTISHPSESLNKEVSLKTLLAS